MFCTVENKAVIKEKIIDHYLYIDENKKLLRIINEKNQDIDEILKKLQIQNRIISSMKNTNYKLQEYIIILQKSIEDIEDKIHMLNIEKSLEEQNYYRIVNDYENKIKELIEQNERLFIDLNFKMSSLLSLINEKDIIIQKFMK